VAEKCDDENGEKSGTKLHLYRFIRANWKTS
jgi:hypothetical protein